MMSSEHIIEVNEANFQNDVVVYSNTIPVVVDFWAEWCQPCHMLTPILEKLAREANGAFRLAKVNADETPNLNIQLSIGSLPTVKAFHKGQLAAEFVGLQTELYVRDFLRKLSPAPGGLELERGQGYLQMQNWELAATAFRKALKTTPDNGAALLGLARAQLAKGDAEGALVSLMDFPASKHFANAEKLLPLAQALSRLEASPDDFPQDDLGIAYQRAISLVQRGNL
ncbi:MAG TPA: thioredoxin domain-containing protein, partial [Anaerolineales bacterium]|nr:thioredoxin domain-containing protein [Anaerolineales bacterium]